MTEQSSPRIASKAEWLEARQALLAKEKAMARQLDELRAERRALPWVRVTTDYVFEAPGGKVSLAELFQGRSQLAVYHFMLTPGSDHICPGCSFISDHVDAARQHFENADLSFVAISRAPLQQIQAVKARMGWTFDWVSSHASSFNYDFGVSFRKEDIAAGRAIYNFGTQPIKESEDMHGTSIFARGRDGQIHHTYSTYARGDEVTIGAFHWLDLTPKGRNENGTMSWVKLHDEYAPRQAKGGSCCE